MDSTLRPPPPDYQPTEGIRPPPPDYSAADASDTTTSDRLRDGASPLFNRDQMAALPPQENWLTRNYRDYVAEPVTKAVSFMGEYDPMEAYQKWTGQPVTNQWPHLAAPGSPQAQTESDAFARQVVPQTPAGGAGAVAGAAAAPFGLLANILAPAIAAGGASLLSGNPEQEAGVDAALAGGIGGASKVITQGGSALIRALPWMKGLINESQAQGLQGVIGGINRDASLAVNDQAVSPLLKGGTTMAKLRQAATGGDLHQAASDSMGAAMKQIDALAGSPSLAGDALNRGYEMLPQIIKDELIGPLGAQGYTLEQAQAIRSYMGSKAFAQSPQGQGLTPAAQQSLWKKMTDEINSFLPPEGQALWAQANKQYGGISVIDEFLNERAATQGLPNRMFLNRNTLSDYLDVNRADLIRRMGREQYDQVVQSVLGGAQPGTRDILTPGAGTPLSALLQTLGRGTNTGSINAVGVPLRTALPGVGSEWTGRAAFGADPGVQALMNYLTQQQADDFRRAQQGQPVKIGPVP